MINIRSILISFLLAPSFLAQASADSLKDWAGSYSGLMLFGGFSGTWGNGGAMSFEITCDEELHVVVNGVSVTPTSITYSGGGVLAWTMPQGSVSTTLAETLTNNYYFRNLAVYPGNTCSGGCFGGVFNGLDFRGDASSRSQCPPPCPTAGCGGDPHFKTWTGLWYDFHGICDLVLLHAKDFANGLGLSIHIRTKERYGYSFIEASAIKIGKHILEVGSFGEYSFNSVRSASMPALMGNEFVVSHEQKNKKAHSFKVSLDSNGKEAIVVSTFKDMVTVMVENATEANFGSSVGLMGNFAKSKLLARDGTSVMEDHNAFGQEWQVLASEGQLFEASRAPQHPAKCFIPIAKTSRRLGESIAMEAAEKACAQYQEAEKKDMRVFDVMAMGDLEVAEIHGAF